MVKSKHMTARLGGAFLLDSYDESEEGVGTKEEFASWYGHIGYVFVDLPDGTTMQLFYNNETRLFVADINNAEETGGIEFVLKTVPTP